MQMEDPVLAEAGLRLAGPCPDGRAAHPAASAGRHWQRRRACAPSAAPTLRNARRATSELRQQTTRTPTAGRQRIMTGIGRSGGTLSPGRPGPRSFRPEAACARGPKQATPRPQEQGRRTCGTERVFKPRSANPAPLPLSPFHRLLPLGLALTGTGRGREVGHRRQIAALLVGCDDCSLCTCAIRDQFEQARH